jgi:hypothetical protein
MNNVTNLSTYAAAHPRTLPTAAPQQSGNTITLERALATGTSPDVLRAVADWNERKGYDARFRPARMRHKAQCAALREVAGRLGQTTTSLAA